LNAGFASSSGGSFAFASGAWGGERLWYAAKAITAANTTAANPAKLPERDEALLGWRSRFGEPALARLTGARPVRGSAGAIASAEFNVPTRITQTAFVRPSLPVWVSKVSCSPTFGATPSRGNAETWTNTSEPP
jgi:hypothetical protein